MILLDSSSTLQVVLAEAATTQAALYAAYVDIASDGTTYAPGATTGDTNDTTAVTWVDSPASDTFRQIKYLSLYNADSAAMDVTVSAAGKMLLEATLAAGATLEFDGSSFNQASPAGGSGAVDSVNGETGAVTLTEGDIVAGINAQTGTTYTAVLTDEVVTMDNASANTLTIPLNSSVAFPIGRALEVWQKGAGQTTIAAGSGVTIQYGASNTLKLKEQNSGCSLRKVATNTWRLIGDMEQV